MSKNLDKLYQKVILEEAKNAFHFEIKEEYNFKERAYNPICGDRFDLYIDIENNSIKDIAFHGFGCTISKASTSLMIKNLIGKSIPDAKQSVAEFLAAIQDQTQQLQGELKVFEKVENFKGRLDCIALSWTALKNYLDKF